MPRSKKTPKKVLKQAAHRAAFLSIYGDRRLIGIPDIRDHLVKQATHEAMDYCYSAKSIDEKLGFDENVEAAQEAQAQAVLAARHAIDTAKGNSA